MRIAVAAALALLIAGPSIAAGPLNFKIRTFNACTGDLILSDAVHFGTAEVGEDYLALDNQVQIVTIPILQRPTFKCIGDDLDACAEEQSAITDKARLVGVTQSPVDIYPLIYPFVNPTPAIVAVDVEVKLRPNGAVKKGYGTIIVDADGILGERCRSTGVIKLFTD